MTKKILGNTSLSNFDALVIGSGAGGGAIAHILTKNGQKVLVLEAGPNYFEGLDDPSPQNLRTLFSGDELKLTQRKFIQPDPVVDPRTFRTSESKGIRTYIGDVNHLPKTVGGGSVHADLKTPRFMSQDFHLGELQKTFPGTSFADWPVDYDQLEKFYDYVEYTVGVQGIAGANPFEDRRSRPYPMPPGNPTKSGLLVMDAGKKLGLHPFPFPAAVNSMPYDGRPACVDCGMCAGYGCPNSSKNSSAVTTLRRALLSGNCQLHSETRVVKLLHSGSKITGVEALDPQGKKIIFYADRYILAATPIENTRLLLLSDGDSNLGLGNSSGYMGRNLMFHYQTRAIGVFQERLHFLRSRSASHGLLDFRGVAGQSDKPLGGVVEVNGFAEPINESLNYAQRMGLHGNALKEFMRQSPLRDRLMVLMMQGEDAPQLTNRVDLDPAVRDFDRYLVARVTYKNHKFEKEASGFYGPKLVHLLHEAGAKYAFVAPQDDIPDTGHIMGTLRFGNDPRTSVCDAGGKFHDFENLYAADGSLFPTSSGLNPTLTIITLSTYVGAHMLNPQSPEQALA